MRKLIGFVLFSLIFVLASANSQFKSAESSGPYDWNNFLTEVETTVADIELKSAKLEKEISSEPTKRAEQITEVDQMTTRIILIQNMIDFEFKYRDQLNQSQKNLLEIYKNKALRLRQELKDLKTKLN